MNYFLNKTASIALVAIAMASGVSLIQRLASASQENLTEPNSSINETQIAQASEPIETQPGQNGWNVELVNTKVAGQVLHVTIQYIPPEHTKNYSCNLGDHFEIVEYSIEDVNYIDDAIAQQYGVLKNDAGEYLASPKEENDDTEKIYFQGCNQPTPAWFKFPAPSPETQTISINIPGVGPFVAVPLQR